MSINITNQVNKLTDTGKTHNEKSRLGDSADASTRQTPVAPADDRVTLNNVTTTEPRGSKRLETREDAQELARNVAQELRSNEQLAAGVHGKLTNNSVESLLRM